MATLSARGNQGEYKARCSSARTTFDLTTSLGVSGSVRRWRCICQHAALNTTDCICNEAMKFSTRTSNVAIYAANTFDDDKRGIFNRAVVLWREIQIPCGAPPSGSLIFAGVCMQLDVHDAPLSDKMDGLYGPHTFTPLTARPWSGACAEGRGNCTEGPRGRGRASALLNNVGF